MNVDDYGEIINGPYTYKGIANRVKERESVIMVGLMRNTHI